MGADRVGANPLAEGGWVKPFGGWLGGADFQHLRGEFLWAPVIDRVTIPYVGERIGQRKAWIICFQAVILVALIGWSMLRFSRQYLAGDGDRTLPRPRRHRILPLMPCGSSRLTPARQPRWRPVPRSMLLAGGVAIKLAASLPWYRPTGSRMRALQITGSLALSALG